MTWGLWQNVGFVALCFILLPWIRSTRVTRKSLKFPTCSNNVSPTSCAELGSPTWPFHGRVPGRSPTWTWTSTTLGEAWPGRNPWTTNSWWLTTCTKRCPWRTQGLLGCWWCWGISLGCYPTTYISGWWFGTFFIFPYIIGNNDPNWLMFFRGVGQPPTRYKWYSKYSINMVPNKCVNPIHLLPLLKTRVLLVFLCFPFGSFWGMGWPSRKWILVISAPLLVGLWLLGCTKNADFTSDDGIMMGCC